MSTRSERLKSFARQAFPNDGPIDIEGDQMKCLHPHCTGDHHHGNPTDGLCPSMRRKNAVANRAYRRRASGMLASSLRTFRERVARYEATRQY